MSCGDEVSLGRREFFIRRGLCAGRLYEGFANAKALAKPQTQNLNGNQFFLDVMKAREIKSVCPGIATEGKCIKGQCFHLRGHFVQLVPQSKSMAYLCPADKCMHLFEHCPAYALLCAGGAKHWRGMTCSKE